MKRRFRTLLRLAGPCIALSAVAAAWLVSSPYVIRRAFLLDVAVAALAAGVTLMVLPRTVQPNRGIALAWLACGALLIAAPHILGAPHPDAHIVPDPQERARSCIPINPNDLAANAWCLVMPLPLS